MLEHAISPVLERRLLDLFGEGGACPHGNPFNPVPAERSSRCFPLSEAPQDAALRVVRIAELHEKERDFLNSLARVGLKPGIVLRVLKKTFDGIVEVRVGKQKAAFSEQSGARIWVEPLAG